MKKIIVKNEDSGQRIDKFLAREFFSCSRGEIIKNIKSGHILVNARKIKPGYFLKAGDEIILNVEFKKESLAANSGIKPDIVFQNPDFLIINKPAGLQVHPDSNEKKRTLVNGLIHKFPEIIDVHDDSPGSELRPGIVHRLDKDTSGIMVVARNNEALRELKKLFQERKIAKKYLALIYGHLKETRGEIKKALARSGNYRKQIIAGAKTRTKIRPAVTRYRVLKEIGSCTLMEVLPITGRTHQIRIHFASIRMPVVGDKLYCPKDLRKKMPALSLSRGNTEKSLLKRHLLHAQELKFVLFGEKYAFRAGLPEDFQTFLRSLDYGNKKR